MSPSVRSSRWEKGIEDGCQQARSCKVNVEVVISLGNERESQSPTAGQEASKKQADRKPSHAGAEQEIRQAWFHVSEQVTVTQHPLPLKRCDLPERAQAQSRADLGNGQEG